MIFLTFLFALPATCPGFIYNLGNFTFEFKGQYYTAEYIFNFTDARFGLGCSEGYVPAIFNSSLKRADFFDQMPLKASRIGCFTAGERVKPLDKNASNITANHDRERELWVWKFGRESEMIPKSIWENDEPNNFEGHGENYGWLQPMKGFVDVTDVKLPHCCMKVNGGVQSVINASAADCIPPCIHGTCVGRDECQCEKDYEGRDCNSKKCASEWYGPDCERPCQNCGENGFCLVSLFEKFTSVHGCTCLAGYNGTSCEKKCNEGTWGPVCSEKCPRCHNGGSCHHVHGGCECRPDFEGTYCEKSSSEANLASPQHLLIYLLIAIGVLLTVIIAVIICNKRKRNAKLREGDPKDSIELMVTNDTYDSGNDYDYIPAKMANKVLTQKQPPPPYPHCGTSLTISDEQVANCIAPGVILL